MHCTTSKPVIKEIEHYNPYTFPYIHTQTTSMASPSNSNTSSPTEKYPCPTEFNVLDFVPKLLSDRNYQKWKSLMLGFIEKQGLSGFIDGTAKVEIGNQDYNAWKKSDNLVQGWILATLAEDTRLQMLKEKTAKDMWTILEQMFDLMSPWPLGIPMSLFK